MRRVRAMVLALVLVVPAAADEVVPTADWHLLSAGREFTLRAPPGTKFQPLQGEDSFVGEFVHPKFRIGFDYGRWSNNLAGMDPPRYTAERIVVDGRAGVIKWGQGEGDLSWGCAGQLVALYVPQVRRGGDDKLEMDGCTADAAQVPVLIAVFKSVRLLRH